MRELTLNALPAPEREAIQRERERLTLQCELDAALHLAGIPKLKADEGEGDGRNTPIP